MRIVPLIVVVLDWQHSLGCNAPIIPYSEMYTKVIGRLHKLRVLCALCNLQLSTNDRKGPDRSLRPFAARHIVRISVGRSSKKGGSPGSQRVRQEKRFRDHV